MPKRMIQLSLIDGALAGHEVSQNSVSTTVRQLSESELHQVLAYLEGLFGSNIYIMTSRVHGKPCTVFATPEAMRAIDKMALASITTHPR